MICCTGRPLLCTAVQRTRRQGRRMLPLLRDVAGCMHTSEPCCCCVCCRQACLWLWLWQA